MTPAGALTPMVDAVEWVGDPDDTEFEVIVLLDTDDDLADKLFFRSDTRVWTVLFDGEPPSADELAAHRPDTWVEPPRPVADHALRVLRDVADAHRADPRIGPRAAALVQAFVPERDTPRYVTAEIARELHVVGDDERCLAVCALLDEPFDGDYGHWGGIDACIALAGYLVGRRSGLDDERFRHWHDRFTEPERWERTPVVVNSIERLYELYAAADANYLAAAPADRRGAATRTLTSALELWMRGAPGGDPSWNQLATRIDELVADLRTLT